MSKSKVSFFKIQTLVILSKFEFSHQKVDTNSLENETLQSIPNLRWLIFNIFKWATLQFSQIQHTEMLILMKIACQFDMKIQMGFK